MFFCWTRCFARALYAFLRDQVARARVSLLTVSIMAFFSRKKGRGKKGGGEVGKLNSANDIVVVTRHSDRLPGITGPVE